MLNISTVIFLLLQISAYQYSAQITESVSRVKCREYGQKINSCNFSNDEIVQHGHYPHIVSIGYDRNETKYECSGVLISDQYVVTTSYCRYSYEFGAAVKAKLGVLNLNETNNEANFQEINITKFFNHPMNKPPLRYKDISLMKLEHPVEINEYVRPACLPDLNEKPEKYILTGWEVHDKSKRKKILTALYNVFEISNQECSISYPKSNRTLKNGIDAVSQICAGPSETVCKMLGGAPLQSEDKRVNCMYDIHGISSFGSRACPSPYPTVFTKIAPYVDWIEKIVWPISAFTNFDELILIGH